MGFFNFGKRRDVVDLGERYRRQQERKKSSEPKSESEENSKEEIPFAFFDNQTDENQISGSSSEEVLDLSETINARRKKLTKRILDMTSKLEETENKVYHLQQRIEVLERKLDVNRFE